MKKTRVLPLDLDSSLETTLKEKPESKLETTLEDMLGEKVESAERISGGRNSQAYRLVGPDGQMRVAKMYFAPGAGERDRMEAEFAGSSFLWANGERAVPEPIAVHRGSRCVLFRHVDGAAIPSGAVTGSDIDQAVAFSVRLMELTRAEGSTGIGAASEACLSVQDIVRNIGHRLARLRETEAAYPKLSEFLRGEFSPALAETADWCQQAASVFGISFKIALAREQLTLSPSDFGFHNALKQPDGSVVFMDLEHFGWDDPAKMVSDFLLHPAMELPDRLKARFFNGTVAGLSWCRRLAERVEVVYPLYGLKWCMILLNEFLPEQMARRGFATPVKQDLAKLQGEQLEKARRMLHKVKREYERFPYRN